MANRPQRQRRQQSQRIRRLVEMRPQQQELLCLLPAATVAQRRWRLVDSTEPTGEWQRLWWRTNRPCCRCRRWSGCPNRRERSWRQWRPLPRHSLRCAAWHHHRWRHPRAATHRTPWRLAAATRKREQFSFTVVRRSSLCSQWSEPEKRRCSVRIPRLPSPPHLFGSIDSANHAAAGRSAVPTACAWRSKQKRNETNRTPTTIPHDWTITMAAAMCVRGDSMLVLS